MNRMKQLSLAGADPQGSILGGDGSGVVSPGRVDRAVLPKAKRRPSADAVGCDAAEPLKPALVRLLRSGDRRGAALPPWLRQFAWLDAFEDESSILPFRHLPEKHDLAVAIFEDRGYHMMNWTIENFAKGGERSEIVRFA